MMNNRIKSALNSGSNYQWEYDENECVIDVKGDFEIMSNSLIRRGELSVKFGVVNGIIGAEGMGLKSLKGFPIRVYGDILVYNNPIKELKWMPEVFTGALYIHMKDIPIENYSTLIPDLELFRANGFKILFEDENYIPYRDGYYEQKMLGLI